MLVDDKAAKRKDSVNRVEEEDVLVVYYSFGFGRGKRGRVRDEMWCVRREEIRGEGDVGWRDKGKCKRGLRMPRR